MRFSVSVDLDVPRPRPPRRRHLLGAALVGLLLVPASAVAGHQFSDVPGSHTFHEDVAAARLAGLTAGCSATAFCPDAPVTRGQMTAFLGRGLGRIDATQFDALLTTSATVPIAAVTVRAGNFTGGTMRVLVTANVHLGIGSAGCPCEVEIRIGNPGVVSYNHNVNIDPLPAGAGNNNVAGLVRAVLSVPTGVPQTYTLYAERDDGSADVRARGVLTAEVVPFDGNGDPAMPNAAP